MNKEKLTYSEAIEMVMKDNGGYAPLKYIYDNIEKYRKKTGKTPDNTIQERVQRDKRFKRIGLGVYCLVDYLDKLPTKNSVKNDVEREHAIIQGMLLEIGNHRGYDTYTNDKKWLFDKKQLGSLSTLSKVPAFTYPNIIKNTVRFSDVIWFNERNFPNSIFEVEHSTDFRDALIKFSELQDFKVQFYCIAEEKRKDKFNREIEKTVFKNIRDQVIFRNYEQIKEEYKSLRESFL